ncbi:MAG: hypothetical protein QM753_14985 [Thermomicrobiales bacterium]
MNRAPGPILALALPDDPFVVALRSAWGGDIWQPVDLAEVGWSVTLGDGAAGVRLIDRVGGRSWPSEELAGIWFQALPPLRSIEALDERDRQYVIAEVRSSLDAVWKNAACPVIGHPRAEGIDAVLGPGPEARLAMQALGLPTAWMTVGAQRIAHLAETGTAVRVTPLGAGGSYWLDPNRSDAEALGDLDRAVALTGETRTVRVLVVAGDDLRAFTVSASGDTDRIDPTAHDIELAATIRAASGLAIVLAFCCQQDGEWRITRLSAQCPWWLADADDTAAWIAAHLIGRFAAIGVAP